jgi:hypothetical protein
MLTKTVSNLDDGLGVRHRPLIKHNFNTEIISERSLNGKTGHKLLFPIGTKRPYSAKKSSV